MKKSTLISILALLTAIAGVLIALAAYFNKKKEVLCDDFDDDLLSDEPDDVEYYAAHIDDEPAEEPEEVPVDECPDCGEVCEEEPQVEEPTEENA